MRRTVLLSFALVLLAALTAPEVGADPEDEVVAACNTGWELVIGDTRAGACESLPKNTRCDPDVSMAVTTEGLQARYVVDADCHSGAWFREGESVTNTVEGEMRGYEDPGGRTWVKDIDWKPTLSRTQRHKSTFGTRMCNTTPGIVTTVTGWVQMRNRFGSDSASGGPAYCN